MKSSTAGSSSAAPDAPAGRLALRGARPHAYTLGEGMQPGEAPGLGIDIDEALAATCPYRRAYLPVARLTDGTVHNW